MKLGPYNTDASKTLEQLTRQDWGDPAKAPTGMIETVIRACKKPLNALDDEEIRLLIAQDVGFPFILDLVWPILNKDPLYCFRDYEGDVLATLLRVPEDIWLGRPEYRAGLEGLKQRVLAAPDYINDMFRDVVDGKR